MSNSELIIEKVGAGRAIEYTVEVLDCYGVLVFNGYEFTRKQAETIGNKWLSMTDAISDYKKACNAIDKAYTDEAMEQCRIYAQQKHDEVFALADKLGIDHIEIDLTL